MPANSWRECRMYRGKISWANVFAIKKPKEKLITTKSGDQRGKKSKHFHLSIIVGIAHKALGCDHNVINTYCAAPHSRRNAGNDVSYLHRLCCRTDKNSPRSAKGDLTASHVPYVGVNFMVCINVK